MRGRLHCAARSSAQKSLLLVFAPVVQLQKQLGVQKSSRGQSHAAGPIRAAVGCRCSQHPRFENPHFGLKVPCGPHETRSVHFQLKHQCLLAQLVVLAATVSRCAVK